MKGRGAVRIPVCTGSLGHGESSLCHMLHREEGLGVSMKDNSPALGQAVGDVGNVTHLLV